MQELNQEVQDDMKITVNITLGDIVAAILGWMWEFATLPWRWLATQSEKVSLDDEIKSSDATQV